MQRPSLPQIIAILFVLALVWLGAKIEARIRKLRERARGQAAVKRGQLAEREAEDFLKSQGYKLIGRHTPGSYAMTIDGESQVVHVKADYLLDKGGKKIVAEVKTGKAAKIENQDTRRQCLEYQLAFGVDSLLLVDMDARKMRTLHFPIGSRVAGTPAASAPATPKQRANRRWALIATVGVVLAWWLARPAEPKPGVEAKHALDDENAGEAKPARDAKPARARDAKSTPETKSTRAPAGKHGRESASGNP